MNSPVRIGPAAEPVAAESFGEMEQQVHLELNENDRALFVKYMRPFGIQKKSISYIFNFFTATLTKRFMKVLNQLRT